MIDRCGWRMAGLALLVWLIASELSWAQRGPVLVELTPVVQREVATGQTFVATVMPSRRAVVGSAVDGRVIEFLVDEGDRVEEGEPLAQLLTETISLEVEAAEAELDLRKQQLAELENGSRPEEIEQARARREAAKALLSFLESERVRLEQLVSNRAISASDFERAISLAIEASEKYEEAKAAYRLAVDGPRVEQIAQARAQMAMQDAIVRRLKDQLQKHTVIARFAGYVSAEHTEVGQWLMRGDPVVEIVALDEVELVAKVVEEHIAYIKVGDTVRVEVPSLPQSMVKEALTGEVLTVVPQADIRSRTFPVKVAVRNRITESKEPLLKAGMLARVTLATGQPQQAMLVPKDAIVLGGPQPAVWAIDANSIRPGEAGMRQANARSVAVQLGVADDGLIQVQGDLDVGQMVIVKGNERIQGGPPGRPSPVTWADASTTAAAAAAE
jgi:RND family efflux transporter MFP subunit